MKNSIINKVGMFFIIAVLATATSCKDMFNNPLKDSETGEDMTLLLVDFNFFKTTFTIELIDAQTNERIIGVAEIIPGGENGSSIVDFAGKKKSSFSTTVGTIELALDPAVKPTKEAPASITFRAEAQGYESITTIEQFYSEGHKTVQVYMINLTEANEIQEDVTGEYDEDNGFNFELGYIGSGLKSANINQNEQKPFSYRFNISNESLLLFKNLNDQFIFKDLNDFKTQFANNPSGFIKLTLGFKIINNKSLTTINNVSVWRTIHEGVKIEAITIAGQAVKAFGGAKVTNTLTWNDTPSPEYFGFYDLSKSAYTGLETYFSGLKQFKFVASGNTAITCELGTKINFTSQPGVGFNFTAAIFDAQNQQIGFKSFNGNFNQAFLFERATDQPATLKFINNYHTYEKLPDLKIESLCSGEYTVNVVPKPGLEVYEVALTAICPDNPTVGISPSYTAEYKPKNETNAPWQSIKMDGGVIKIFGQANTSYIFRINYDGEYIEIEISTDPSKVQTNENTKLEFLEKQNNVHRIKVTHKFTQNICNSMGW